MVEGESLAPFAKGQSFHRRTPVMTSRFAHPEAKNTGYIPENRIDTVALLDTNWKLIYREKAKEANMKRVELYDRRTDRVEASNVAAQNPQEVERLMAEIGRWMDAQKQIKSFLGRGAKATMDQKTLEQLRSPGYIRGKQ